MLGQVAAWVLGRVNQVLETTFSAFLSLPRRRKHFLIALNTVALLTIYYSYYGTQELSLFRSEQISQAAADLVDVYIRRGPFESIELRGFVNTGVPKQKSCDALRYDGTIGVQKSVHLNDDLRPVAKLLDSHERIDYSDEDIADPNLSSDQLIEKMWHGMSGSSVWLPDFQVYLLVKRVAFGGDRWSPDISFLRGQLFSEDWEHLESYDISWGNRTYTFPLLFDIPIPFTGDGVWLGTEDPRVLLEDNVPGAEPIVIFNMVAPITEWKRAMYLYRPFSQQLTLLTIKDIHRQRPDMEKNWAPFFVPEYSKENPKIRVPNEHIHFVYRNRNTVILRCHLGCGDCVWAFEQTVPSGLFKGHREDSGDLRGGTNFVPVPLILSPNIRHRVDVFLAFPRTHIDTNCGALYRPEMVVLIRVDDHFYMTFASQSLDFGSAIVEVGPEDDPCSKGRVMIPMSITRWDTLPHLMLDPVWGDRHPIAPFLDSESNTDIMTATFSIDDQTVQVARIAGLLAFVRDIPQVKALQKMQPAEDNEESEVKHMLSSWVADDIRGCLVESAINYSLPTTGKWRSGHNGQNEQHEEIDQKHEFLLKEYREKEMYKNKEKQKEIANEESKIEAEKERERQRIHEELIKAGVEKDLEAAAEEDQQSSEGKEVHDGIEDSEKEGEETRGGKEKEEDKENPEDKQKSEQEKEEDTDEHKSAELAEKLADELREIKKNEAPTESEIEAQ